MKKVLFFTILLVVIFITGIIILICSNSENLVYDDKVLTGNFNYEQAITDEIIDSKYYYSDSFFKEDSDVLNYQLILFAFDLSLAFNPSRSEEIINYNIKKMLEELNFIDLEFSDLEEFSKDTIGTSIAHKKLNNKYDLVTLTLRGSDYKDEWKSNFDLGIEGNANGFEDAALLAISRLDNYLKKYKIKDYKLLVSGYSRAGAVSNLIGLYLNENQDSYNINKNDLYVFTFESPNSSNKDKIFNNIYNIVNRNDIITYFYPLKWGVHNNGKTIDITTQNKTITSKCLNIFDKEKIKTFNEVDIKEFLENFIEMLPDKREEYAKVSYSITNVYTLLRSKSSSEINKIFEFFKNNNLNLSDYLNIVTLIGSDNEESVKESFYEFISYYDKNYNKISNILTKEEYEKFKEDVFKIFIFFRPFIKEDLNYSKDGESCKLYNILTLATNVQDIIKEHYFSTNLDSFLFKYS